MMRNIRSRDITCDDRCPTGYADMDMNVLERQLETLRLNLLHYRQQQLQQQQNNYMLQNNFMPELVCLFDNSSADADMFGWQGEPDIMEKDDVNFSENFPLQTEQAHPPTGGPIEVKEAAAVEKEVMLLINDDSDDDAVLIDNPQPVPEKHNFSMFGNGKPEVFNFSMFGKGNPEFTAEEACNEERENVEADAESSGKKRAKAKPSPYTTNDDPVLQKLECIREQVKRTNRNERPSLAEKIRRQRISEMLQCLQEMIPGCKQDSNKSLVDVLTEVIIYLKYLQNQNQYVQLLAEEARPQNPTSDCNVHVTPQVLAKENATSRRNPIFENNFHVTRQLLAEEAAASRQNPTSEIKVNIKPTSEGNQNFMFNASEGRRRKDKANKLAVKKKKPHPYRGRYRPAPAGNGLARNANFAYLTQQANAIYKQDSLSFAPPLITTARASNLLQIGISHNNIFSNMNPLFRIQKQ